MLQNQNLEERFSEDYEENLRIENDILKLKLHASYGGEIHVGGSDDMPADIENMFLKNVFAFEEAMQHEVLIKLHDHLGKPDFLLEKDLSEMDITIELKKLYAILKSNGIVLDVLGDYDNRIIYKFITEELFEHEVLMSSNVPRFTLHFIYEEFHPNHVYDIKNRISEFFSDWFERKFDEYSFELANSMIIDGDKIMTRAELINKMHTIFESYVAFHDHSYSITDQNYHIDQELLTGIGYVEGEVKYYATLENDKEILIRGKFKFYLSYENSWWQIFNFQCPGFEW